MKENTKQYLKYKGKFKTLGILNIATNCAMLLTLVFLIFLPCFRINLLKEINSDGLSFHFSLYDEVVLSFKNLFDVNFNSGEGAIKFLLSFYQVFAMIFIGVAAGILIKDVIVSVMNTVNLNDYALEEYDKIKAKQDQTLGKSFKRFSSTNFFISGISLELVAIVFSKLLTSMTNGFDPMEISTSYFSYMNGIAGSCVLVIILLLCSVVLLIMKSRMRKSIKLQILKEDYHVNDTDEEGGLDQNG